MAVRISTRSASGYETRSSNKRRRYQDEESYALGRYYDAKGDQGRRRSRALAQGWGHGLRAGVERTMAKAPPLAIEAFTIWIRHLILAAFEITIGWLVRRLIARPRPSNVFSFPT